jgi:hypothetical protein
LEVSQTYWPLQSRAQLTSDGSNEEVRSSRSLPLSLKRRAMMCSTDCGVASLIACGTHGIEHTQSTRGFKCTTLEFDSGRIGSCSAVQFRAVLHCNLVNDARSVSAPQGRCASAVQVCASASRFRTSRSFFATSSYHKLNLVRARYELVCTHTSSYTDAHGTEALARAASSYE